MCSAGGGDGRCEMGLAGRKDSGSVRPHTLAGRLRTLAIAVLLTFAPQVPSSCEMADPGCHPQERQQLSRVGVFGPAPPRPGRAGCVVRHVDHTHRACLGGAAIVKTFFLPLPLAPAHPLATGTGAPPRAGRAPQLPHVHRHDHLRLQQQQPRGVLTNSSQVCGWEAEAKQEQGGWNERPVGQRAAHVPPRRPPCVCLGFLDFMNTIITAHITTHATCSCRSCPAPRLPPRDACVWPVPPVRPGKRSLPSCAPLHGMRRAAATTPGSGRSPVSEGAGGVRSVGEQQQEHRGRAASGGGPRGGTAAPDACAWACARVPGISCVAAGLCACLFPGMGCTHRGHDASHSPNQPSSHLIRDALICVARGGSSGSWQQQVSSFEAGRVLSRMRSSLEMSSLRSW